jgi:L-cysteine/cystine lyase
VSLAIPAEQLAEARAALPALRHAVYGNTGTAGPLPEAAADALQDAFADEVARGRIAPGAHRAAFEAAEAARGELARLLCTDPERVALTHHTTDGLNIAAMGLRWRAGDVAVTTDLEHLAVQAVLGMLRVRCGVEVRVVPLRHAQDADEACRLLAPALRGPVRALFLSHVSYATGAVLPLAALAEAAHAAGAAVVVDGAQSVGAMRVAPAELGADLYTVSGQKWLCGPEGTGALWVAPGWEERLLPSSLGYAGVLRIDAEGHYLPAAGARRFEVGTTFAPGHAGLAASLRWLQSIGWEAVWQRTFTLAEAARRALGAVRGLEVLTPPEHAGLVSFRTAGVAAERMVERLRERGYLVRSIPGWEAVRLSCGFFLEEAEINGFVAEVADLAREAGAAG